MTGVDGRTREISRLRGEVNELRTLVGKPTQDQPQTSSWLSKGVKVLLGTTAVAIGSAALFKMYYPSNFSPSLDSHDVDNSAYKNFHDEYHGMYSQSCDGLALKAETLFFNLFESNEYLSSLVGQRSSDINGALQGFLEDRNLNAFKCTYQTYKNEAPLREDRALRFSKITGTLYKRQDTVKDTRDKLLERVFKRFERTDSDKFASFLLYNGANPNLELKNVKSLDQSVKYSTPLLYTYEHNDRTMMETLLDRGAKPETTLKIKKSRSFAYDDDLYETEGESSYGRYRAISTLDYIVDKTSKLKKSEGLCQTHKKVLKIMIPYHGSCADGIDKHWCKRLRFAIPEKMKSSACLKLFQEDSYFTQPEWTSKGDMAKSASNIGDLAVSLFGNVVDLGSNFLDLGTVLLSDANDAFWNFFDKAKKWGKHYANWQKESNDRRSNSKSHQSHGNSKSKAPKPLTRKEAEARFGLSWGYTEKKLSRACRKALIAFHPDVTAKKVKELPIEEQTAAKEKFVEEYYLVNNACDLLREHNGWGQASKKSRDEEKRKNF